MCICRKITNKKWDTRIHVPKLKGQKNKSKKNISSSVFSIFAYLYHLPNISKTVCPSADSARYSTDAARRFSRAARASKAEANCRPSRQFSRKAWCHHDGYNQHFTATPPMEILRKKTGSLDMMDMIHKMISINFFLHFGINHWSHKRLGDCGLTQISFHLHTALVHWLHVSLGNESLGPPHIHPPQCWDLDGLNADRQHPRKQRPKAERPETLNWILLPPVLPLLLFFQL